jgi:hypothetical protein
VYVVYLPALAQQAGIDRQWVPWILAADQVIFAVMDVITGFWVDHVRRGLTRIGGWMLAISAVSCAAFLLLPFTSFAGPGVLLALILLWALSSSALRSPPWALLSRYAAKPQLPWLSTLVLTGTAVASAAAPFLGVALKGVDPRVPFVLSSVVLLAAVGLLVIAERRIAAAQPAPAGEAEPPFDLAAPGARASLILFFATLLALAVGFQVHTAMNSSAGYLRFAPAADLPWLLPVFWVGFNLLMFPLSRLVRRTGGPAMLAVGAAAGAVAFAAATRAESLSELLAVQFFAGGCWGAVCVAAFTMAALFGRRSREGLMLGGLFATLAAGTFARIGAGASGIAATAEFKAAAPWLPLLAWSLAAMLAVLLIPAASRAAGRSTIAAGK